MMAQLIVRRSVPQRAGDRGAQKKGVERVRHRDTAMAGRLEAWLSGISADHSDRIVPITTERCC
jgi:hypothetical protein